MSKFLKAVMVTAELLEPLLPLYQPAQEMDQEGRLLIRKSVQEGKHIFVVGRSGMGKTYLTKKLIRRKLDIQPWLNVYHLDTKKRGDFSSRDGQVFSGEGLPPVYKDGGHRVVWQPIEDNKELYSKFFLKVLNTEAPAIVHVNEAVNMVFGGNDSIPRGLKILLSQGRLPGIHVFGETQELAKAPRQMISQATHLFGFNVENDYDERMLMSYLRLDSQKHLDLKKAEFYHRNRDLGSKATLYHDVKDYISRFV